MRHTIIRRSVLLLLFFLRSQRLIQLQVLSNLYVDLLNNKETGPAPGQDAELSAQQLVLPLPTAPLFHTFPLSLHLFVLCGPDHGISIC